MLYYNHTSFSNIKQPRKSKIRRLYNKSTFNYSIRNLRVRFLSQLTKADYKVCQAKLYMNRLKKADNKPKKKTGPSLMQLEAIQRIPK